jgi:UDP-N-acetylmuramoyl-L-alanyl-D-glutamate--2,6-diaminopimelate ligase
MKLRELLRDVPLRREVDDVEISSITADSRLVKPGALFVAIPGTALDGMKFVPQAREKGAAAIVGLPVASSQLPGNRQPATGNSFIDVDDPRAALAIIAANFYGRPADKLSLVGITGTSGKTTTTKMVESIFDATGEAVGLIGTIEYRAGDERLSADRTTPDAVVLQEWFAKMVDAGVRHAVMEVSSHALALKRTYGVNFDVAVFTNLSQDHFDFHKGFEDYFQAKRILFTQTKARVINADDPYGRRLINEFKGSMTYGRADADITPDIEATVRGLHGKLRTPIGDVTVESRLIGLPNLYNWMAAVGAAIAAGCTREQIEAGIRNLEAVRGRFESVQIVPLPAGEGVQRAGEGPTVIVDYAHKPDALEKLLHAVRELASGKRIVVLFGCGGDRDKSKRPLMGEIAARLADEVVLTSDNPRSEDPERILDDIERGAGAVPHKRIADRRLAIEQAILAASDEDVIVIAGKGHEAYQVIGERVVHFDDREEAELALKKRRQKTTQNPTRKMN